MLKNTAGQPSASYTMMIVGFVVITLWLVVSIFKQIGPVEIHPFSGTEALAYFAPLASLYFGRRWTDAKNIDAGPANSPTTPTDSTK